MRILPALISIFLLSCIYAAAPAPAQDDTSSTLTGSMNIVEEEIFASYETWPPKSVHRLEMEALRNAVCVLETSKGIIRITLFPDEAPIHSANFVKLIQDGFYDGLTFHRVIDGFVSQGGDPEGTGGGGPGYELPAEILLPHIEGSVAAARMGDAVNPERMSSGSQFYLCHTIEQCEHLDGTYSVFGQIIEGQDVNLALTVTGPRFIEPDIIIRAWVEWAD